MNASKPSKHQTLHGVQLDVASKPSKHPCHPIKGEIVKTFMIGGRRTKAVRTKNPHGI